MPSEMRKAHLKDSALRALRYSREHIMEVERLCKQQPRGNPPGLARLLRRSIEQIERTTEQVKDIPITQADRLAKERTRVAGRNGAG